MNQFPVSRLALLLIVVAVAARHLPAQEADNAIVRRLDEFGPLGNPQQAQQTWQVAREAMRERPGMLIVPAQAWSMLKPDALQSLIRARSTTRQSTASRSLSATPLQKTRRSTGCWCGDAVSKHQPGINTAGRIIEVVTGKPFEDFLDERLFQPLGMHDTTFRPSEERAARVAKS